MSKTNSSTNKLKCEEKKKKKNTKSSFDNLFDFILPSFRGEF